MNGDRPGPNQRVLSLVTGIKRHGTLGVIPLTRTGGLVVQVFHGVDHGDVGEVRSRLHQVTTAVISPDSGPVAAMVTLRGRTMEWTMIPGGR